MDVKKKERYIEINGVDINGDFLIRIYKDCSQLQFETEDDKAYINLNYRGLNIIRNAITEVLEGRFIKKL